MASTVVEVLAKLRADTTDMVRGFREVETQGGAMASKVDAAGQSMARVGGGLSRSVTLPLVAAGGAGVKMANDFETSMSQITGLVGIPKDEVADWEDQVKQLGPSYGKSAGEAADALFFITSAGLRGDDAMQALEASLKASASGLGEVSTIADLATSAMNAYGPDTLNAAGATDTLTAAVREGKLEPAALAGAMGQVLPIASNMGISFDQVGAAMASMSRTGTNASEASTQLRSIMTSLLKPTGQAEEALAGMGLSSGDLREQIREKGLLATLQTLQQEFDGNDEAAAKVFGNVRALSGVMDMMGAGADTTAQIFDNMTNVTGDLDTAFAETSETGGFQFAQAMERAKTALMEVGEAIAPFVTMMANAISSLAGWFSGLNEPTQKLVITIGALVAAAGPVILILGKIVSAAASLAPVFKVLGKTLGIAAKAVGFLGKAFFLLGKALLTNPIILIIAAIAAAAYLIYRNWDTIVEWFRNLWASVTAIFQSFLDWVKGIWAGVTEWVSSAWSGVTEWFSQMWDTIKQLFSDAVAAVVTTVVTWKDNTVAAIVALKDAVVGWVTDMWDRIRTAFTTAVEAVVGLVTGLKDRIVEIVTTLVAQYIAFIVNLRDRVVELVTALRDRFVELVTGLRDRAVELATNLRDRVVEFVTNLRDRVVELVTNLRDRYIALVTALRDRVVELVTNLRDRVVEFVTNLRDRAVALVTALRDRFVALVTNLRDRAVALVTALRDRFVNLVTNLRDRVVEFVTNMRDRFVNLVTNLRDRAVSLVTSARDRVVSAANEMKRRVIAAAQDLKDGAVEKFLSLVLWVTGLPGRILGALGDVGSMLLDAGRSILGGLWSGMRAKWDEMTGWIGSLGGRIASLKGPIEKDRKLLIGEGDAIMQGLNRGLRSGWTDNERLLAGMAAQMQDALAVTVPMSAQAGLSLADTQARQQLSGAVQGGPVGRSGGDVNFHFGEGSIVVQAGSEPTEAALARKLRDVGYRMVSR